MTSLAGFSDLHLGYGAGYASGNRQVDGNSDRAWSPPVALYQGVQAIPMNNHLAMAGRSTAVSGNQHRANGRSIVSVAMAHDSTSLNASVGFKLSGGMALADSASAKGKLEFLMSLNIAQFDVTLVVHALHLPLAAYATDFRFKAGISPAQPGFRDHYGEVWVSSVKQGAEFLCIYNFKSNSVEQRLKVINELAGSGTLAGGNVNLDSSFELSLASAKKHATLNSKEFFQGLSKPTYFMPEKTPVAEYADAFLKVEPDVPMIAEIAFTDYRSVPFT